MNLADYLKNTSQEAFAKRLGVTQSAVSQWIRKRVPGERVLAIEAATDGIVSRHELRPDLYPIEQAA
ncbi:MAG TPA: Cro/CI family transcriptional regulator [Burkholderiales bacterium]|nr:Cro/CI family transcriptional regulator [Burkholderiales bacterium]